jgi:predicted DCC family thiol-disulfide oxidoreductase YuxK
MGISPEMRYYSSWQLALFRILAGLYYSARHGIYIADLLAQIGREGGRLYAADALQTTWLALLAAAGLQLFSALALILGLYRRAAAGLWLFASCALFYVSAPSHVALTETLAGLTVTAWIITLLQTGPAFLLLFAPAGDALAWRPEARPARWRLPTLVYAFGWMLLLLAALNMALIPDYRGYLAQLAALLFVFCADARWARPRPSRNSEEPLVVLFDGVCGLCNSSVDFIMAEDRDRIFRFAPLQGESARRLAPDYDVNQMDSVALRDEDGVHVRSAAILRIGLRLGGMWRFAILGFLIPAALRDSVYDWVARNRYRWFGKKESCRMPTAEERALFLM